MENPYCSCRLTRLWAQINASLMALKDCIRERVNMDYPQHKWPESPRICGYM